MLLTEGLAAFSVRQGEVEAVEAWCRFKVVVAAWLGSALSMQTFLASLTWSVVTASLARAASGSLQSSPLLLTVHGGVACCGRSGISTTSAMWMNVTLVFRRETKCISYVRQDQFTHI
jgi:hypothetical protein